jgi:aldose 1-epimerase
LTLSIRSDHSHAEIELFGGRVLAYETIFDEASFHWLVSSEPGGAGCFPMLPFAFRLRDGKFKFGDQQVALPANVAEDRHPMHGFAWQQPWRLVTHSDSAICMHSESTDLWPWNYEAYQTISLVGDDLLLEMSVSNLADTEMPLGFGWHPFFNRSAQTQVHAKCSLQAELDEAYMFKRWHKNAPLVLETGLVLSGGCDDVYGGWLGSAMIRWSDKLALHMTANSTLDHLVLYAPATRPFFCLEPASMVPNAFNVEGGLLPESLILQGSQTKVFSARFSPIVG